MNVIPLPSRTNDGSNETTITDRALDILMPLHVRVSADGEITGAGRTFLKLFEGRATIGQSLFNVLVVKRPSQVKSVGTLLENVGASLVVQISPMTHHNMKAVVAAMPDGGALLNLALGAGVMDVVHARGLKNNDFSPADPTVEMIYMIEVQSILYQQHKEQSQRLQGARDHAEEQAFTDALTGLANRRAVENHLARLLRRSKGKGFAVMQIDLDFFKAVNDTHGHAAGDFVLQETSRALLCQTRATDMVARIGGDEFVIVLSDYGDKSSLSEVGHRIIAAVGEPIPFEDVQCKIGASIGATIVAQGSERTSEQILSDADRALYVSKEQGRGLYHLDTELVGDVSTTHPC